HSPNPRRRPRGGRCRPCRFCPWFRSNRQRRQTRGTETRQRPPRLLVERMIWGSGPGRKGRASPGGHCLDPVAHLVKMRSAVQTPHPRFVGAGKLFSKVSGPLTLKAQSRMEWNLSTDVVVIGAGAAGLAAAVAARDHGAAVVVVEENFDIGGHAM